MKSVIVLFKFIKFKTKYIYDLHLARTRMKGLIFREFIEMTESMFGYETADEILSDPGLRSGGIYTNVGFYDHSEIFVLVNALSRKTGIASSMLFFDFGLHVFDVFTKKYPAIISEFSDPFGFIINVENYIHVEVLKLYPDAELPEFKLLSENTEGAEMIYTSTRKMADFANGLITACFRFYNVKVKIEKRDLSNDNSRVRFIISKTDG